MKDSKGVTLIELLAVLALIGLVMSLIISLFLFGNRNFSQQNEQTSVVSNARYSMDYLTRQIRKATEIQLKKAENTTATKIELKENGNTLVVDSDEIKLEDNALYHNNYEIATGIDNLIITRNGNEVTINIVLIDRNAKEYKLSSNIYLRGK